MKKRRPELKRTSRFLIALIFLFSVGGIASARDSGGKLGFIRSPISTRPVFVRPGDKITVDAAQSIYDSCACPFHVYLEKDGTRNLIDPAEKIDNPATGTYSFSVTIPANTAPGLYGFAVQKGSNDDISNRAIMVLDKYPDEYTIMHITDVHIGRMEGDFARGESFYEKMAERANELKPDIVIITGDVTDFSDPDQFKTFLDITDRIDSPTVVVPGNHDRNFADADKYLGPGKFSFNYGAHFYLGFDTQYQFPIPDPEGNMDWIRKEMRAHRDSPFKVMFSHRDDSDFRLIISQVILPYNVNLFLSGHTHADAEEKIGKLPSYYLVTQAAVDGYYRIIKIKNNTVDGFKTANVND
jgi:predicted MPP superfamily phosphohydrolase